MKAPQSVAPFLLTAVAALMISAPVRADGDVGAGARVFNQCRACHNLEGKNGLGPSLKGVIGRKAGTAAGFKTYSPAMQKSGITWTEDNLKKYLANPKAFVPGNRMVFPGLKKSEDVENVIAYIKKESAE